MTSPGEPPAGNLTPGTGTILGGAVIALTAAAAIASFTWWTGSQPATKLALRVPIPANRGSAGTEGTDIEGQFALLSETIPTRVSRVPAGEWPRFRGADFDNIVRSGSIADSWPAGGPPVLWSVELGEGYAGAAVKNGKVYILDYDEVLRSDMLRVFSLADGTELWRRWYRTGAKRNHGISRTVPAVTDRYVVTIGPRCHVMCLDAETGEFKWGLDLVRDFGAEEPLWFTAQHPLVHDGVAILAPAGDDLMMAVDCETGQVLWRTPNPGGWKMSHSSIVPMTVSGQRMYIYAAIGGMAGVAADGPEAGTVLWKTDQWDNSVTAPTPVPLEDGLLFVTAGYGAGSALFRVGEASQGWEAQLVRRFDRTRFGCEQHTPIYYEGTLYTVMPKDGGGLRQQVVAMTPEGEVLFTSGKEDRFGLGPFLVADGKLLVLKGDGELTMARADQPAWEILARAKVLDGRDAWAPMALVDGRLLVRDTGRMVCLDISGDAREERRAGRQGAGGGS